MSPHGIGKPLPSSCPNCKDTPPPDWDAASRSALCRKTTYSACAITRLSGPVVGTTSSSSKPAADSNSRYSFSVRSPAACDCRHENIYYPTIVKANPLVANTTSWISGGFSNYNALELDLRQPFAWPSTPGQLHVRQKPRQWLGVEYKRLGQHTCICLLPGKPLPRLWPCGDRCSPPCCFQRYLRVAHRPWTYSAVLHADAD